MLKNKIIVRKIRNIVILLMALIVMLGAYNNIRNSRAENVASINAVISDYYGFLEHDVIKLEATPIEGDLFEIKLPKDVNTKNVNEIISATVDGEKIEILAAIIDNKETSDDHLEDDRKRILLTEEQLKNGKLNIEMQYGIGIRQEKEDGKFENISLITKTKEEAQKIKITEKSQILVNRILTYQDTEKNKYIELSGLLPLDAYLQVEGVTQEKLKEIFGNAKMNFAYDIKIMQDVISEVPVDEANPDGETQKVKETIEINPEDYGSACSVKIQDSNIYEETKIFHVKEDNKYEKLEKRESKDGTVSFNAESFSIYAGSDDETVEDGAELGASRENGPKLVISGYDGTGSYGTITYTASQTVQKANWANVLKFRITGYCATSGSNCKMKYGTFGSYTISASDSSGLDSSTASTYYDLWTYSNDETQSYGYVCDGHSLYSWDTAVMLRVDTKAPTISSATATNASNNLSSTITISATDTWGGSGSNGPAGIYQYSFDNGSTWQTGNTKTVTTNATYTVKVKDNAGNISSSKTVTVSGVVNAVAPTFTLSQSPTGWTNGNVTVTATVSNNGGVAISGYNFNSAGYQTSNSKAFSANGKVTVVVKNSAGLTSTKEITISNIDKADPTAGTLTMKLGSLTGSNYTNDTWTNQSVYVYANDGSDALSGHKSTTYQVGTNAAKGTGTANATSLNSGGNVTIKVTTTDNAGNTASNSYTVKVDKAAPTAGTLTMKLNNNSGSAYSNNTWTNQSVYVYASDGSDALSGHSSTTYKVGSNAAKGTGTANATTLTETGTYTIVVTTTDNATNTATNTYTVKIDKAAPTAGTLTMKLNNNSGSTYTNNTWTNQSVYVYANAGSDANSGHSSTTYKVGTNAAKGTGTANATTLTETGTYTIVVTTTDNATNTATNTYTVKIDKAKPTAGTLTMKLNNNSGSAYTNNTWTNQSVYVYANAGSDANSGHSSTTYKVGTNAAKGTGTTNATTLSTEGTYSIVVTTTDNATNTATNTYTVKIDKTVPTATGITFSSTYTTTGKTRATANGFTDSLSGTHWMTWYVKNSAGTYVVNAENPTGYWYKDIDVSSLSEGKYLVGIVIDDNAGNENDTTASGIGWVPFYYDKTPPTAGTLTMKLNNNSGATYTNNTWTNQSVYVYANAGTDATTTATTTYSVNGGSAKGTGTANATTLTETGTYTIVVTTTDQVGLSASNTYTVKVDKTNPTAGTLTMKLGSTSGSDYTNNTWTNSSVVVWAVNGSDSHSGHSSTTYSVDGGTAIASGSANATTLSTTGTYSIVVTTTDAVGNSASSSAHTVKVDKTDPTVGTLSMKLGSTSGSDYTNNTWTSSSVVVWAVNGSDSHSGHSSTTYSVNGGTAKSSGTANATTLSSTGTYSIVVTTTDVAGNSVSSSTYTVKVDKTNPTAGTLTMKLDSTSGSDYTNNTWTNSSVVVWAVNGSDSHSGHSSTTYSIDGGTAKASGSANATTLSTTGTYSVVVTTTDVAGNSASSSTYTVKVDKTDPTVGTLQMKLDSTSGSDYTNNTWTNHSVVIWAVNGSDSHSGHSSTTYSVNGGAAKSSGTANATTLSTTGTYSVVVTTTDVAGNSASSDTYTIKVDQTDPTVGTLTMKLDSTTGSDYTNNTWTSSDVVVWAVNGSDSHSGHSSTTYSVDGGAAKASGSANATTLNTTGTYSIIVTTTDVAGNSVSSSAYTVKVDKTAPTAPTTMEFSFGDWTRYTQGTWTNKNVYAAYSSSQKGPTGAADDHSGVAKYQISTDNSSWADYSYSSTATMYKMSTEGTHTRYFRAVDAVGNAGPSISRTAKIDKTKPVWASQNFTVTSSTQTATIELVGTDALSGVSASTLQPSNITVYVDGEEASDVSVAVGTATNVTGGIKHTLTLTGWEKSARNANNYKDWSGTVQIKVAAGCLTDVAGNSNNEQTLAGGYIDVIKPDIKYSHQSTDIDQGNKKYVMTFSITDKYYTSGVLDINDLEITMQNGQVDSNGDLIVYDLKDEPVTMTLRNSDIRVSSMKMTNTSNSIVTVTNQLIGHTYTLTIEGLEELGIEEGDTTANYSGIVSVQIAANQIADRNTNKNIQKTITSGVDVPGGSTGDEVVVDVVDPLLTRVSSSTDVINKTSTIKINATDTYFASSSLTSAKLEVYIDGVKTTTGITVNIAGPTALNETRIENGTTKTEQYGNQYTITISGFDTDVKQVKLKVLSGVVTDDSGNTNKDTDFPLYNTLRVAADDSGNYESEVTSKFLNETVASGKTAIQRQNIQKVVFVNSISGSTATGVQNVWDVSAIGDDSILAWYSQTSAPYTVYIGSDAEIFANIDSSYLFMGIGASSSCTETAPLSGLNLLNTYSVTNMNSMFRSFGSNAMTTLNLGNFDTRNVTTMQNMFDGCGTMAMTTMDLGTKFDTSNVRYMNNMFTWCGLMSMTSLDLGDNFDTGNVLNMSEMYEFCGYQAMTSFDLGDKFDTSNVVFMGSMFLACGQTAMTTLDLGPNFDTSSVTDMSSMFANCGSGAMTSLDLGDKFDTSNVTNMSGMFESFGRTAMTTLDLGPNFDTSSVTNMSSMFWSCGMDAMTSLDLGDKFDTSNVTNMRNMFSLCGLVSMTSLDLGDKFDTTNVTDMYAMFERCGEVALTSLDLGNKFDTTNVGNMTNMFKGCGKTAMTSLDLGPKFTKIAEDSTDFATDCGVSGATIYAPESIYSNKNGFKKNND